MHYKTIMLELLEQDRALHRRLKGSRTLLSSMERYAIALKTSHESWMERLRLGGPGSDPAQISSEAMELAVEEIRDLIAAESPPDGGMVETSALPRHRTTPPA